MPFTDITQGEGQSPCCGEVSVENVLEALNTLRWFLPQDCCELTDEERGRIRGRVLPQNAFRGVI